VHSPDSRAAGEELPPLIVLEHHAGGMMAHFEVVR
jgi:hypothetical protein